MRVFSLKPVCDKCRSKNICRTYHSASEDAGKVGSSDCRIRFGSALTVEHHVLYCRGCGFTWQEQIAPVDFDVKNKAIKGPGDLK